MKLNRLVCVVLAALMLVPSALGTTRVRTAPLADRVREAELIFTGKIIDRQIDGDWARAKLLVSEPLRGGEKGQMVEVVWRVRVGDLVIYDAQEGFRGVALLKDKRDGRYWLGHDKFEGLGRLEKIKQIIKEQAGDGQD